jgi:hypothetical protein
VIDLEVDMGRVAQRGRALTLAVGFALFFIPGLFSARLLGEPPVGQMSEAEVRALALGWGTSAPQLEGEPMRWLARAPGNFQVKVFFGAWSDDSQRQLPRFLKIVADLGGAPFAVEFIAVDRDKKQPARLLKNDDVRFLPTFVVSRQGREVGRIVVRPARGLESDLALLLTGKTRGLISGSEEVIWDYLAPQRPEKGGGRQQN